MIQSRKSIIPDISWVAHRMREEDRSEVFAASGMSPYKALMNGYIQSNECFTLIADDEPMCMFGYRKEKDAPAAMIWMLATNLLVKHRWAFLRISRPWIDYLHGQAPLLYNYVDQRNVVHINWLSWLGFKFVRTVPNFGYQKLPFIEFVRINHVRSS